MIKISNLTKTFESLSVLNGVSFDIKDGETVVIIGKSGSGKTTLLRCLNFLEHADAGELTIGDAHVDFSAVKKADERAIRRKTAMVFQSYNLFYNLSALQNISEALIYVKKMNKNDAKDRAMELLCKVGLEEKANFYPKQLSGGQKQRIGIARAMAVDPELLLLDEPTSALDPELIEEVSATIKELKRDDRTMLVVTHEIRLAMDIASKIIFMENGNIVETGTPEEILYHPQQERTKEFLMRIHREGGL